LAISVFYFHFTCYLYGLGLGLVRPTVRVRLGLQWRAEGGGQTGRRPRASKAGGIQKVKLQTFKCCN